ncbi:MerR family DNA-binding transcriptional regulator [Paenibacillus sp. JNUCC31]|uniref:MerR family DNA-binding transcriptional regulator n=1 Tax=Paenibacillus sp. JNUCC-31 TaxID=2777983 RepID=UPI00177ABDDB|nr:MerR family DNA-binding transcriptional regulator [Paenibacillus sp. JNUCC-31]QOS76925.1 MerR family DNA-binding transcriptional regulator [Paenibacillus sp. JNUCC-31]
MNQSKDTYTIGEAAKMIGSTVKTIRYYDEIELLRRSGNPDRNNEFHALHSATSQTA